MPYYVLTDQEVKSVLVMHDVVQKMENAFIEKSNGTLVAPPRFRVDAENGALVFTAGAMQNEGVIGFRVYDTFKSPDMEKHQLVAVFDSENGTFKGIVIGNEIGAIRTGAIGGVAIKHMSRADAKILGVLGSGMQARTQVEAAAAVRNFETVKVYSPNHEHRESFVHDMRKKLHIEIEAVDSAKKAVQDVDVLICATGSTNPVFQVDWLKKGVHINTVGSKFQNAHEVDIEVAKASQVISTDSLAQVEAYPKPFFLTNTPEKNRMIELSDIVTGTRLGRNSPEDITLFCSVGLSGTEVVVANEVLRLYENMLGKSKK